MSTHNILDRTLAYFSPGLGARRAQARAKIEAFGSAQRSYKAAGRGRRFKSWRTPLSSADAASEGALPTLKSRSRDLVRNNTYAGHAVDLVETNVVGLGVLPEIKDDRIRDLWEEWSGPSKACDADGRTSFAGLQALFIRAIAEGGEVIVRRRPRRGSDGLVVPLQLQVLEADHLDDSKHGEQASGVRNFRGVEFDALNRRTAYWILRNHPGDSSLHSDTSSSRVPASDVIHGYRLLRAGQVRGIPWGASALLKLLELDRFEDAQLLRQEIAACFAAFVTNIDGDPGPVGGDDFPETIEPGMIHRLGPGEGIEMASPPGVQNYQEFFRQVLLAIAVGYGVSYEALTGDLKGVNYSSGRMGWLEFGRKIAVWQRRIVVEQFCHTVWSWFMDAAQVAGLVDKPVSVTWTAPRREMVDPTKEIPAQKDAVRSGFMSLSDVIRQNGGKPEDVLAAIATDNAKIDKLGLVLDSDPRQERRTTTGSGTDQDDEEKDEEESDSD